MKRIIIPGRNCWTVEETSDAGVLVDGRAYYRELYRAAKKARRYIAMTGWQFDSDVSLLRGEDLEEARGGEVRLLPMLDALCRANPELHVYILAWDFSLLLAMEREWMQHLLFNWTTNERVRFRFDPSSPLYGAHHQKLVVIDGVQAFSGGMDVCDCRWDDRDHRLSSSLRCDSGRDPHGPYHDVQAVFTGPVVGRLTELFEARWAHSGGGELHLPTVARDDVTFSSSVPAPPGPVAISRTFGKTLLPPQEAVQEVRALFLDAIEAADRFIYIENQYFSSRAIFQALVRRFRESGRPPIQVVLVLPKQPEALREQLAMGIAQVRLLRALERVARETGNTFRVYCSAARDEQTGEDVYTYIHSKVMVVDDRFLTLGSANTTNRSLGLDSELNLSWEAEADGDAVSRAIRRVRVSLMAEHAGLSGAETLAPLMRADAGLVDWLDAVASAGLHRLRPHPMETVFDQSPLLKSLEPEDLVIDPEDSVLDESLFEALRGGEDGLFASGIRLLSRWLVGAAEERPHRAILPADADSEGGGQYGGG
ncbi:phospholipase D-like domain-containing protein [Myxococcus sp. MISCRS1]|uniref:phospholipase D-like domain-containing protein n=1 Tax=Myxococcus TaxID=32 RepID=UPI001CBAA5F3|nr:phospholipase D-like domain-containing protein [Myxococcus sp. MISCRS1]MBZ4411881.1 phospholipase [Myxococcus sp. XM-1-1-1]MCY1000531.1 phospholipase D-like domain-containing protein [Myxococcus sp. MISCRS1]